MTEPSDADLRARFQPVLKAARDELLTSSDQTRADRAPVQLDQQSVGRLSRMDALQGQAMAAAVDARRAGRLRAIGSALTRMDDGEFGYCEDCGEFIGLPRLTLDPTVVRCVDCAS